MNGFFFSVAVESAKSVFEQHTGLQLKFDPSYKDYWCEIAPENLDFFDSGRASKALLYSRRMSCRYPLL